MRQVSLDSWIIRSKRKRPAELFESVDSTTTTTVSGDSPAGSPASASVARLISSDAVETSADAYLDEVARAATGKGYFSHEMERQRFFLGAVLRKDAADSGRVYFGFSGGELEMFLQEIADRHVYRHVHVAALDADDCVASIRTFLTPFGLAAAHEWCSDLDETMGEFLVIRAAHVGGITLAAAGRSYQEYFLRETLGVRTVAKAAVWCQAKKQ